MCVTATARRRRAQAKNGYKHLSPMIRPHYGKADKESAARRLMVLIRRENERRQRKGAK